MPSLYLYFSFSALISDQTETNSFKLYFFLESTIPSFLFLFARMFLLFSWMWFASYFLEPVFAVGALWKIDICSGGRGWRIAAGLFRLRQLYV